MTFSDQLNDFFDCFFLRRCLNNKNDDITKPKNANPCSKFKKGIIMNPLTLSHIKKELVSCSIELNSLWFNLCFIECLFLKA